jgi:periplasmic protein CpxP/Spy
MKSQLVLTAALLLLAAPVEAQVRRDGSRGGDPARSGPPQRQLLERQLQARIDSMVRIRLSPTDEQFNRLREVATRIERERHELRAEDSRTRTEIRRAMATSPINEERVAELLDRLPRMERRRVELFEREQSELARFLSPSQRAHYFALQDELRRNMQEMMRRRLGLDQPAEAGRAAAPGRRPPPR